MAIYTNASSEFFQVTTITADLTTAIPDTLSEKAIGFLICDSEVDYGELLNQLKSKINVPIAGGTTFLDPLTSDDEERSASLTILDLEHLEYTIQVSEPLCLEQCEQQMAQLYQGCVDSLAGKPKMFLLFLPMIAGMSMDPFVTQLVKLSQEIPLFGGMNMNDLDSTQAAVFAAGKAYSDRMVMLALGGEIRPVFAVGSQMTPMSKYAPVVTESIANVVYRLDDMSFCDYMRSIGLSPEDRRNGVEAIVQYGPLPCQLRDKLAEDDGIRELRCISYTNVEQGSASFSSTLPVGTRVSMGVLQKNDVAASFTTCMDTIKEKMAKVEQEGYQFHMLFAIPCVARYFAMLGGENLESRLLREETPKQLAISAYYGFMEIGPTFGEAGEVHNRTHNASIVMCAF